MATAPEGHIDVPGGRVWYRIAGPDAPGVPLLCLHGGPGSTHDYLEPLADLADERPVVFYDQLGCGRSAGPSDPGAVDRGPGGRGAGRGPGRAVARAHAPVRQLLGRLARHGVPAAGPGAAAQRRHLQRERQRGGVAGGRRPAPVRTARGGAGDPRSPRGQRLADLPGVRGGDRALLPAARVPRVTLAGLRGAVVRRHERRDLQRDVGSDRVRPGDRHAAGLRCARQAGSDRRVRRW